MKITSNENQQEFKPFSITITFESEQEAINLLHFYNCSHTTDIEKLFYNGVSSSLPPYDKNIERSFVAFKYLKNILISKGIIK